MFAACAAVVLLAVPMAQAAQVEDSPTPSSQTNGRVSAVDVAGNVAYIGGMFTAVRGAGAAAGTGVARNRAAAIDLATGDVTPWNPNVNGTVQTIAVSGNTVFMGGTFTTVGGKSAQRLVAVNASTGAIIWKANMDKEVMTLTLGHGLVYAGGYFTTANGSARSYLAAFNQTTGALSASWTPKTNLEVKALVLTTDGSRVVVGGDFSTLNGVASNHIGAVNTSSGASLPWASHEAYQVIDMDADANGVYVAGAGAGGNFARFSPTTGQLQWQGGTNGNIQAIAVLNGTVYVGGHYTQYCGATGADRCATFTSRSKLLAVDAATGTLQSWDPDANSVLGIFSLDGSGITLAAGGDFTKVSGTDQQGFAQFEEASPDNTPPVITSLPKMIVQLGATLQAVKVPVRTSFAASDPSGVCGYALQQSVAGGAYQPVTLPSPTTPYASFTATPGPNTHQFEVRATDCALNTSAYAKGDAATLTALQNGNAAVKYAGAWKTSNVGGSYGGSVRSTTAANASASLTFTGREVAWVASKASNRGVAKVYIDGALISSANTYSATTIHRRVVFTRAFTSSGTHTIKVVCTATKNHPMVDVDAFLVVG